MAIETFDADSVRRISRAVKRVEAQHYNDLRLLRRAISNRDHKSRVRIRNSSGADREQGDVLAIDPDSLDVKPSDDLVKFKRLPALVGITPAIATHLGKFVVLEQSLKQSRIGWGVLSGIVVAQLDASPASTEHPYADIADASTRLTSGWYGSAEILFEETTGGERWAIVRMGSFESPDYKGVVTEAGGITAGSSGDVDILIGGTHHTNDAEETITAELSWMEGSDDAANDAEVLVRYFRDEQKWRITQIEC